MSINPIDIQTFFGELGGPSFLHYNLAPTDSLGYQIGLLSEAPWPDKISVFFKL